VLLSQLLQACGWLLCVCDSWLLLLLLGGLLLHTLMQLLHLLHQLLQGWLYVYSGWLLLLLLSGLLLHLLLQLLYLPWELLLLLGGLLLHLLLQLLYLPWELLQGRRWLGVCDSWLSMVLGTLQGGLLLLLLLELPHFGGKCSHLNVCVCVGGGEV